MRIAWKKLENNWRRQLLSFAKGNILEIGIEAGVNFRYYPIGVRVTGIDTSEKLLEKAKEEAKRNRISSRFIISSVDDVELEPNSFDTIVSTFALSAYDDPMSVLRSFHKWCRKDGTILLLEYGASRYGIVNWIQRQWEPHHYKNVGTHLNRDLIAMINDAGLKLRRAEMRWVGSVYLVWATIELKERLECN